MQQKDNLKNIQIIKGSIFGVISLFVIILMFSFFIYKRNLTDKFYVPLLFLSSLLSGLISGFSGTRKLRKNGLVNGAVSAMIPAIILLIAMMVANGKFGIFMFLPIAVIAVSGAIGGILAVNIKRKNKKK